MADSRVQSRMPGRGTGAPPHAGARRADRDAARSGRGSPRGEPPVDRRFARVVRGEAAPRSSTLRGRTSSRRTGRLRVVLGRRGPPHIPRRPPARGAVSRDPRRDLGLHLRGLNGRRGHGPLGRAPGRDPAGARVRGDHARRHLADPRPDPRAAPADHRGRDRPRARRTPDRVHGRRDQPVRVHAGAHRRGRGDRRDAGGDPPADRRRRRDLPRGHGLRRADPFGSPQRDHHRDRGHQPDRAVPDRLRRHGDRKGAAPGARGCQPPGDRGPAHGPAVRARTCSPRSIARSTAASARVAASAC